jgi:hypothetical protein
LVVLCDGSYDVLKVFWPFDYVKEQNGIYEGVIESEDCQYQDCELNIKNPNDYIIEIIPVCDDEEDFTKETFFHFIGGELMFRVANDWLVELHEVVGHEASFFF